MALLVLVLLGYGVSGYLMNRKPAMPVVNSGESALPGFHTVGMLQQMMAAQLNGFGGWLPNDLPGSPGWFLDNLPNFQMGLLQVTRHGTRVLRDNLTRQRTSDAVHKQTDLAYTAFANDPYKWAFPSAEGRFGKGGEALLAFQADLGAGGNFYPRADNLVQLLEPLVSELGAVTTLLLNSRGPEVSWLKVDNNFYYAQGVGYAMLGLMQATRVDFAQVLQDKNAVEITDTIIESLLESQFDPWLVTNGGKSGILANHSNNLKVYLDDARQKMNSLITILTRG